MLILTTRLKYHVLPLLKANYPDGIMYRHRTVLQPTHLENNKISANLALAILGNHVYGCLLAQISSLWIMLFGAFYNMLPTEHHTAMLTLLKMPSETLSPEYLGRACTSFRRHVEAVIKEL